MNPSWYDVLGVDQDADDEAIRAAWKDSIADLEPSDRRFRQRNRAAEVLLDPEQRAAHDAELAAAEVEEADQEPDEEPDDEPVSLEKAPRAAEPEVSGPPALAVVTALLGLVALVLVVFTVVSYVRDDDGDDPVETAAPSSGRGLPDAAEVEAAVSAAEAAIDPVLSFDYRNLEASKQAAVTFMTPEFAEEYQANFEGFVVPNAESTKTIVTTDLVASGVVRTGVDRVDVLLFVNQPTRNVERDEVYRLQVTARMVEVDGSWLVGCLIDQPGAKCDT